ncbi:RNA-dependent RNA polymerase, partial [Phenoliferia sp. Uapishka_3]
MLILLIDGKAMAETRDALKAVGTDCSQIPSAAQARCGSVAKGVWTLAPLDLWPGRRFIEARDSQWKFEDAQTSEFVFEVLNIPHGKGSANLGKQTIESEQVLGHAGVPPKVFSDLLKTQIADSANTMLDWSNLAVLLREIEKNSSVFEDRARKAKLCSNPAALKSYTPNEIKSTEELDLNFVLDGRLDPLSAAPNTIAEVVVEMLQTGFDPNLHPPLASKIEKVAVDHAGSQIQFKIDSKQCRTVLVIADHLGILEEGEVFFQASEPVEDEHGFPRSVMEGPILVSRPPCLQPCDVQKYNAVFKSEYSRLYDVSFTWCLTTAGFLTKACLQVIVMSVKGPQPACSILSGGDYDGDKLLIIMIEAIIQSFDPARADPRFATPPFKDEKWFKVDRTKVKDVISPLVEAKDSGRLSVALTSSLFLFSSFSIMAGTHNTLSYTLGLDHPRTSEAAHVLAKSLDGRKQGFSHSSAQWEQIRKYFEMGNAAKPAYAIRDETKNYDKKLSGDVKIAKRGVTLPKHPLDALISTGMLCIQALKDNFTAKIASLELSIDPDVAEVWRAAHLATAPVSGHPKESWRSLFQQDLGAIHEHIYSLLQHGSDTSVHTGVKFGAYKLPSSPQDCFTRYKEMRQIWSSERDRREKSATLANAPGSPTKSPTKKWKGSSPSHKQDLLDLTKSFWDLPTFCSPNLLGPGGKEFARALVASCAYLLPISPNEFTFVSDGDDGVGKRTFLDTLLCARVNSASTTESSASAGSVAAAAMDLDDDPFLSTQFSMSYSQVECAEAGLVSPSTLRTASRSPSTSRTTSASPSKPPRTWRLTFAEATRHSAYTFGFDMAHRDLTGLKADAITRRLHPGTGLQAFKLSPYMHTVMGVKNKSAAGIVDAKRKTRPRTLLPPPEEVLQSPSKRSKTS